MNRLLPLYTYLSLSRISPSLHSDISNRPLRVIIDLSNVRGRESIYVFFFMDDAIFNLMPFELSHYRSITNGR